MRILADANILLDVLLRREPHFDASYSILRKAASRHAEVVTPVSSITDIYYVLRKAGVSDPDSRSGLHNLMVLAHPVDVLAEDALAALDSLLPDYEDALVSEVARRLKCDAIVTRDRTGFAGAPVRAMSPESFLKEHPDA